MNHTLTVDSSARRIQALLPPGVKHVEDALMDAVPALGQHMGQHTEALLHELGFTDADVRKWRDARVI